jgi:sulfide:quinone oxidoreductase
MSSPVTPATPMQHAPRRTKLRVLIAGGGVAALEAALALKEMAPGETDVTVLAPNTDFVYRPMTVREPFAYAQASRYSLAPIVQHAGAELRADELAWIDPAKRLVHTIGDDEIEYDALLLAIGARPRPRYKNAVTIDDHCLDETLHGLVQDIEGGYIGSLAFVIPGRMAWPLPVYELALMAAGRSFDMNLALAVTIVTPEDAPLAIFGKAASDAVGALLAARGIQIVTSAYAEVPRAGEVEIHPGERRVQADRVIALPELFGPSVRGLPVAEHGFIHVNQFGLVPDAGPIFAAGDATDFAVKHGGIAAQQSDTAAASIAALAGVTITPEPFRPTIRGVLLTDGEPLYMAARITGGTGFDSEVTDATSGPLPKIAARYLAPYLDAQDQDGRPSPAVPALA